MNRSPLLARLNAWRKHSIFSPHWLDWRHLRGSVEELAPFARGVLLDVGCSERPYGKLFAPYVTRHVGLDYPPALLDKQPGLWTILDRAKRSVDVFGDGNRLPFRDERFDTVLATEVLEHVRSPATLLREMARVLKPGGRVLLTVPFVQPLHELPSDYYRFTPASLRSLLERAGFTVEAVEPRGNYASALGVLGSQFLLRRFGPRSLIVLPVAAFLQTWFHLLSKWLPDDSLVLGYRAVGRRPFPAPLVCQADRAIEHLPEALPR